MYKQKTWELLLLSLTLLVFCKITQAAQTNGFIPTPQRADNLVVQEMAQKIFGVRHNKDVTIHLKDDFEFNPETFFEDYKEAFGLGEHDEMRLTKIIGEEDKITPKHNVVKKGYQFQQYYKKIPVGNHKYQITYKERGPIKISGNILEGLDLDVKPAISEQKALQIVTDSIKAVSYCWQSGGDCPQAIPIGKLQVIEYPNIHLIYHFSNIQVAVGKPAFIAQVDAKSGEITYLREMICRGF